MSISFAILLLNFVKSKNVLIIIQYLKKEVTEV